MSELLLSSTREHENGGVLARIPYNVAATAGKLLVEKGFGATIEDVSLNPNPQVDRITLTQSGLTSTIDVVDTNGFYAGLIHRGDVAFIGRYVRGLWRPVAQETDRPPETSIDDPESDALVTVLRTWMRATEPIKKIKDRAANVLAVGGLRDFVAVRRHNPDIAMDATRIQQHYDRMNSRLAPPNGILSHLGLYSSGDWSNGVETLEEADEQKARLVVDLLNLQQDNLKVLEIGAGWGGQALRVLESNPTVALTLLVTSQEQYEYLVHKFSSTQHRSRVTILKEDYRTHAANNRSTYDRIYSLEVNEHTPWQELKASFIDGHMRMLRPEGEIVLQAIMIDEPHHNSYKYALDYINTEVFPGGNLHTERSFVEDGFKAAGMELVYAQDLTADYVKHLGQWRKRAVALDMPPQERRWWNAYLAACEAGFMDGNVTDKIYKFAPSLSARNRLGSN